MTEEGWSVCVNPFTLWRHLDDARKLGDRKPLLLLIAYARPRWDLLASEAQRACESAERVLRGAMTWTEFSERHPPRRGMSRGPGIWLGPIVRDILAQICQRAADDAYSELQRAWSGGGLDRARRVAAALGLTEGAAHDPRDGWVEAQFREYQALERIIRDLFGNPFRSVVVDLAWLTPEVAGLARVIDGEGAFDRMLTLRELLVDAGCRDPDILGHCYSQTPHVPGCWVVDALLGRG